MTKNRYREKLLEAARALVSDGDLDMRLSQVAGCLLQIDERDIPADALTDFVRVRDPLIANCMLATDTLPPMDLETLQAKVAAQGVLDLLVAELGRQ